MTMMLTLHMSRKTWRKRRCGLVDGTDTPRMRVLLYQGIQPPCSTIAIPAMASTLRCANITTVGSIAEAILSAPSLALPSLLLLATVLLRAHPSIRLSNLQ